MQHTWPECVVELHPCRAAEHYWQNQGDRFCGIVFFHSHSNTLFTLPIKENDFDKLYSCRSNIWLLLCGIFSFKMPVIRLLGKMGQGNHGWLINILVRLWVYEFIGKRNCEGLQCKAARAGETEASCSKAWRWTSRWDNGAEKSSQLC